MFQAFAPMKKTVEFGVDTKIVTQMQVDYFYDIVTQSTDFVSDAGISKGWFAHLASYTYKGKSVVAKLTKRAWIFFTLPQFNRTIWLSDQSIPTDVATCTNL